MKTPALVSAVIPTRNRPGLVLRAIASVLAQTYPNLEVVVVVDGPDDDTVRALAGLREDRLRVVALPENVGGSEARNTGVRNARGEWIALLDDDDEWLPEKLTRQMAVAATLPDQNVILSSKFLERSIGESREYPSRLPDPGETLTAYMCCPRALRTGGEVLQTSTLVVPRALMLNVPFVKGLKRGQDFMWLLQGEGLGKASFHVVPEVLSVFNAEGFTDDKRVSSKPNWRSFYDCVRANRLLFTRTSYAYCLATRVLTDVIKCNEPTRVKLQLLRESLSHGLVSPGCVFVFFYVWLVPPDLRVRLGEALRGIKRWTQSSRSPLGAA